MDRKTKEPNNLELNDSASTNIQHFQSILKDVKKIDFIKQMKSFGVVEKPTAKHYQIIAIDELLKLGVGLRYTNESIYIYTGSHWTVITPDEFKSLIGKVVIKMSINRFDGTHYKYKNELFNQFISVAYKVAPEIDKDIVKINLMNGTLEINNGSHQLKEFDQKDFLTYKLSFQYDDQAQAPIFQKYLDRVLPEDSVQKVLSEYIGYVFIRNGSGAIKAEKFLALSGGGSNGKSVLFEVLNRLFGDINISHYSLEELTDSAGYHRAEISNKLLNYSSETTSKVNEAILKQIASGEPVSARSPYGKPFSMNSYAKVICNFNKPLKTVEHTHAFFRRFLIIPFDVTIPDEEQDRELHSKIIDNELPGVLNWILEGLDRLLYNKQFTYSYEIERALERFKLESNSVALFLDDKKYIVADVRTRSKEIYESYVGYCIEEGYHKVSHIEFNRRLKNLKLRGEQVFVRRTSNGQAVNIEVESLIITEEEEEEEKQLDCPF